MPGFIRCEFEEDNLQCERFFDAEPRQYDAENKPIPIYCDEHKKPGAALPKLSNEKNLRNAVIKYCANMTDDELAAHLDHCEQMATEWRIRFLQTRGVQQERLMKLSDSERKERLKHKVVKATSPQNDKPKPKSLLDKIESQSKGRLNKQSLMDALDLDDEEFAKKYRQKKEGQ